MGMPSVRTYEVISGGDDATAGESAAGGAAVSWYYPKGWTDQEDGVEQVAIHYTCTPPEPVAGLVLGARVARPGGPRRVPAQPAQGAAHAPGRSGTCRTGGRRPEYRFHYYFEVFQNGHRWTTDLFSEDIVYRDLEYADDHGWTTNICIYWGVGDWAAPVYSPMEDPRFPADSEFRSTKYYSYWDKERFHHEKFRMLQALDRPHRWRARMYGPRGARWSSSTTSVGCSLPRRRTSSGWARTAGPPRAATGGCTTCRRSP